MFNDAEGAPLPITHSLPERDEPDTDAIQHRLGAAEARLHQGHQPSFAEGVRPPEGKATPERDDPHVASGTSPPAELSGENSAAPAEPDGSSDKIAWRTLSRTLDPA